MDKTNNKGLCEFLLDKIDNLQYKNSALELLSKEISDSVGGALSGKYIQSYSNLLDIRSNEYELMLLQDINYQTSQIINYLQEWKETRECVSVSSKILLKNQYKGYSLYTNNQLNNIIQDLFVDKNKFKEVEGLLNDFYELLPKGEKGAYFTIKILYSGIIALELLAGYNSINVKTIGLIRNIVECPNDMKIVKRIIMQMCDYNCAGDRIYEDPQ